MEALLVHPENEKQLKAILDALDVPFENHSGELPNHILASITKGISQSENGELISLDEFKTKHFSQK